MSMNGLRQIDPVGNEKGRAIDIERDNWPKNAPQKVGEILGCQGYTAKIPLISMILPG